MKIVKNLKPPRPSGTPPLKRRGIYPALKVFLLSAFSLLLSPLNAQNPYEYAKEELFLTSLGVRDQYESDDCATARDYISRFYSADAKGNDNEKQYALRAISFFQCSESYTFFESQIKSSRDETNRCQALMFLARMQNPDYLPVILEYAQNSRLSVEEKAAVATAFMVFGVHTSYTNLKEEAIQMLDEICYDEPADVLVGCIMNYFKIGGAASFKFFYEQLKQKEFELYAALFLARLGEHKQTFPIFAAALSSEDEYEVHTAILGLAAINTDEAIELIMNLPEEKNRVSQKERLIKFNLMDLEKGD